MEERIVVTFRIASGPGRTFLERVRALEARAVARGGVLVAFDASSASFSFDGAELAAALGLALAPGDDCLDGEPRWAVGVAEGDLELLAEDGSRGELGWGPALVSASALARAALPGEIACISTLRAIATGELLVAGKCVAREGALRVRGFRLDAKRPWRRQAVEQLARLRVPKLVGDEPSRAALIAGALVLVRADAGAGGTRWLTELAAEVPRSLVVSPSGAGFEPLGALRRSLARSITRELNPRLVQLAESLEALLAGEGVGLDVAAELVAAFLDGRGVRKGEAKSVGAVLIDDARSVDPASLEACVRAATRPESAIGVVARVDRTAALPSVLAALTKVSETDLDALPRPVAEGLAAGVTSDALDASARRRWARLGGYLPLGIVEAISVGIVTGDIAWSGDVASPRSPLSGRGKPRSAGASVLLRAQSENASCRLVLGLLALLGGAAKVSRLARVLERAREPMDLDGVVEELVRGRWVTDTEEDWIALASRTHAHALGALVPASTKQRLHAAAADVIESEERSLGRVDAGWHAVLAEQRTRASRILLDAARRTATLRLDASTTQLIAFARRADPTCEESALELLANALGQSSIPPASSGPIDRVPLPTDGRPSVDRVLEEFAGLEIAPHDSEPPTIVTAQPPTTSPLAEGQEASDSAMPPPSAVSSAAIASRFGDFAKEALLSADNAALERWATGLKASGESSVFTERMRALSRLRRGDIGDALRVLRRARAELDANDHAQRCQTSLAIGVALSVAGRPQEALLEGMDALSRARRIGDDRGADACLAFLSKLYGSVGREESNLLRRSG